MALIKLNNQSLTAVTSLPAAISTGKIGQVVYGSTNIKVQGSGGGFTDTGLSASITPTATSSKVLVLVTQQTLKNNSASAAGYIYLQLQRQIGGGGYSTQKFVTSLGNYLAGTSTGDANIGANEYSLNFLDTTNTTSQVDYKTTMTNDTGLETQPDDTSGAERGESSMILMEILA